MIGAGSVEEAVYGRLEKLREVWAGQVAAGHCSDFAEYKALTGQIRGVDLAADELKALFKSLRESEG